MYQIPTHAFQLCHNKRGQCKSQKSQMAIAEIEAHIYDKKNESYLENQGDKVDVVEY